jgi:hypothetical protein
MQGNARPPGDTADRRVRGPGPKVVRLPPPLAIVVSDARIVTSDVAIDLQVPIDALRSLKSDLEAYYWDRAGEGERGAAERYQIGFWVRQVTDRTAALESIVMHQGTALLLVPALTPAEAEGLERAGHPGAQWVREGDGFGEVREKVATMLQLADRIGLKAAAGRPRQRGRD